MKSFWSFCARKMIFRFTSVVSLKPSRNTSRFRKSSDGSADVVETGLSFVKKWIRYSDKPPITNHIKSFCITQLLFRFHPLAVPRSFWRYQSVRNFNQTFQPGIFPFQFLNFIASHKLFGRSLLSNVAALPWRSA